MLLLLLLLARFIAFYSSLSVRRCFCGNEDVETAAKCCQRGIESLRGMAGRVGGVASLATQFAATSKAFKIVCNSKSFTGWGVKGVEGVAPSVLMNYCYACRTDNRQISKAFQYARLKLCVCVCDWWFSRILFSVGRRKCLATFSCFNPVAGFKAV